MFLEEDNVKPTWKPSINKISTKTCSKNLLSTFLLIVSFALLFSFVFLHFFLVLALVICYAFMIFLQSKYYFWCLIIILGYVLFVSSIECFSSIIFLNSLFNAVEEPLRPTVTSTILLMCDVVWVPLPSVTFSHL